MKPEPPILDDGKEPSEPDSDAPCQATEDEEPSEPDSDAPCQATEDEDYFFHFVTFEVKGTSQKQS